MFRCHFCGEVVPPRTKVQNVIIESREKNYPGRRNVSRPVGPRSRVKDDPGGSGREIVKEVKACPKCALAQAPPDTE